MRRLLQQEVAGGMVDDDDAEAGIISLTGTGLVDPAGDDYRPATLVLILFKLF